MNFFQVSQHIIRALFCEFFDMGTLNRTRGLDTFRHDAHKPRHDFSHGSRRNYGNFSILLHLNDQYNDKRRYNFN